ncbi:conserved hypothetical protein [Sphingobacterium sp. PM2-P1-29]|jgi:hypothetical protein|uniref:nuclear transport factor 2 family protein n=1 Tax=Sphingobacterium TaxID=28453 RepID=UPI0004E5FE31|nr:nuclear transport factor 2 family protein [Sphingobacterium sp. UBA6320]CDT01740.1 conserved hypothetical protein [Sphingobacterium sp. PM2-P1-29]
MTKADILSQENKLYGAIKDRDINVLEELLHDDLLFVIPSGAVITKEMDLQSYRDGNLMIRNLIPHVEHLNIIDDTAVITLTLELTGNYGGDDFESKFRYIRVWKAFSSGIKVIGGSGMIVNV